jgi:hypothetical protein
LDAAVRSAACVAAVMTAAAAVPAGAVTAAISPRPGRYAGFEVSGTTRLPVSFTVSRDRSRIVTFNGQTAVKAGCTNHIKSFEAPSGPIPIAPDGSFAATSRSYPQDGVRVRVSGHFLTRVKARGHISVRVAKVEGCNISRPFTASRARRAGGAGT